MASDLYQLYDSDLHLLPCDSFFPSFSDTNYSTVPIDDDDFHQQSSLFPPDNLNLLSAAAASPPCSYAGATSTTLPLAIPKDSVNEGISSPLFGSHSYSGGDEEDYFNNNNNNVASCKYMQRSYSINSFEEKPPATALFHNHPPPLDDFHAHFLNSPTDHNSFFGGQIRRVCSTGDLQGSMSCPTTGVGAAAAAAEGSCSNMDEANLKVGRYSAEERRERILKYRAKRNQRNFTKTIKYACRKTLADNRPRIRGRFARNDEIGDLPKAAGSNRDDDEDDFLWGLQEEEEYGPGAGPFCSKSYGGQQAQYHHLY